MLGPGVCWADQKYKNFYRRNLLRIGITGGAGFIGSHLARRCLVDGHEVKVLDDLSTGKLENIENLNLDLIDESIVSAHAIESFMYDLDFVFHLAALGSVPRSLTNPRSTFDANVTGSFNLLEALRKRNIPSVFISSSSVYGNLNQNPKREENVGFPLSPYAASKATMEKFIESYRSAFNLKILVFRLFNVFGPKQRFDHEYSAVIPKWINLALQGKSIEIYGDGTITRDFTFVDEVIDVLLASLDKVSLFNEMNVINLAFGRAITLNDISYILQNHFQSLEIIYGPARASDIVNSTSSSERLRKYFPEVRERLFEDCFYDTLRWIVDNA